MTTAADARSTGEVFAHPSCFGTLDFDGVSIQAVAHRGTLWLRDWDIVGVIECVSVEMEEALLDSLPPGESISVCTITAEDAVKEIGGFISRTGAARMVLNAGALDQPWSQGNMLLRWLAELPIDVSPRHVQGTGNGRVLAVIEGGRA